MISVDIRLKRGAFELNARFTAASNGVTALFGRSGSGKSTIVNAIAGLVRPDHGHIAIAGHTLFDSTTGIDRAVAERGLGYVFQEGRLFPHMSVERNLLYGRRPGASEHPTLAETVALLGLGPLLSRKPNSLSGGERQRVAIGRALLASPRILLMDEPLASLDGARRAEILPYLADLRRSLDIPIIYVSHQMDEIIQLADTMVLVDAGKVVASGPVETLTSRLDLAPLTGGRDAGAVLACAIAEHDPRFGLTRLSFSGGSLWVAALDRSSGETVRVRIGARDVALALAPPSEISMLNVIEARISEIGAPDGAQVDVGLRAGEDALWARLTRRSLSDLGLQPGMTVHALIKAVSIAGATPAASIKADTKKP
jgi:molybdate transport system ATP-binding protein